MSKGEERDEAREGPLTQAEDHGALSEKGARRGSEQKRGVNWFAFLKET